MCVIRIELFIPKLKRKLPNEIWNLIKDYTINNNKYIINNKLKYPTIENIFKFNFHYTLINFPVKLNSNYIFKKYVFDKKIMFSFVNGQFTQIPYYFY